MTEERRCTNQSPCGRRVNPDVCELKHQQWEQLWIEREKRLLERFDAIAKTAEAKSISDAQALVVKATADLVTEARMKEYIDNNTIKWPQVLAAIGTMGVIVTLFLKLVGH